MKSSFIILIVSYFLSQSVLAADCDDPYCTFVKDKEALLAGDLSVDRLNQLKSEILVYQRDLESDFIDQRIGPANKVNHYKKALNELQEFAHLREEVESCGEDGRSLALMQGVLENCPASRYLDERLPLRENNSLVKLGRAIEQQSIKDSAQGFAKKTGDKVLDRTFDQLASYLKETAQFDEVKKLFSAENLKKYNQTKKSSNISNYLPENFKSFDQMDINAQKRKKEIFEKLNALVSKTNSQLSHIEAEIKFQVVVQFGDPLYAEVSPEMQQQYAAIQKGFYQEAQTLGPVGMGGRVFEILNSFPPLDVNTNVWDFRLKLPGKTFGKFLGRVQDKFSLSDVDAAQRNIKEILYKELDNAKKLSEEGNVGDAMAYNPSLIGKLVSQDGIGKSQSLVLCEMMKKYKDKKDLDANIKILKLIVGGVCGVASGVLCFTPAVALGVGVGLACGGLLTGDAVISAMQQDQKVDLLKAALISGQGWTGTSEELALAKNELDQQIFELQLAGGTALLGGILSAAKTVTQAIKMIKYAKGNMPMMKEIAKLGDSAVGGAMSCAL